MTAHDGLDARNAQEVVLMSRFVCVLLTLVLAVPLLRAREETDVSGQFKKIGDDFRKDHAKLIEQLKKTDNKGDKQKLFEQLEKIEHDFAVNCLELAKKNPRDPSSFDVLVNVVNSG